MCQSWFCRKNPELSIYSSLVVVLQWSSRTPFSKQAISLKQVCITRVKIGIFSILLQTSEMCLQKQINFLHVWLPYPVQANVENGGDCVFFFNQWKIISLSPISWHIILNLQYYKLALESSCWSSNSYYTSWHWLTVLLPQDRKFVFCQPLVG